MRRALMTAAALLGLDGAMRKYLLAAVAVLALGGSACASVLDLKCSDIVNMGFNMPSVSQYFPRRALPALPPGAARLDDLVLAQCFLEPDLTVGQAVHLLVAKARRGERLPDIPEEGAH
jgi:hypothetical protein